MEHRHRERRGKVASKISLWLEKLSELLEKLAVAREVAGGIFPLHLAEQGAGTLEHFVTRSLIGRAGGGRRRWRTDEEAFGFG